MIYAAIAAAITVVDTLIKNHMEKALTAGEEKKKLCGRVLLRKHHNEGAFLNIGEKRRPAVAVLSFVLTAAIAVLFVMSLFQKGNAWLKLGLSFLLGGAFSNTYDRMKRKYVMDYMSINVRWKWLNNIVFNLSDFFIIVGALICTMSFTEKEPTA